MKREDADLSRFLDGELPAKDLPEPLRRDVAAFERLMGTLADDRVTLPPTVKSAVLARVRAAAQSPWRRAWRWATAPRLSPLAGALAAAALILATFVLRPAAAPSGPRASASAAIAPIAPIALPTRFVFLAPRAKQVAITGDWIHWDPAGIPLRSPRRDGVWVAEITVPPGLHHYVFIVNGTEWRPDPNAASQVDDGFGQQNSVLLVPAEKAS